MKLIVLLVLMGAAAAFAGTVRGTVKDSSGAVAPGARVTIQNQATGQRNTATTDAAGSFSIDLQEGQYLVTVHREGFDDASQSVTVSKEGAPPLTFTLKIAAQETEVEVTGKRSALANADPNYRALRDSGLSEGFAVENLALKRDTSTITLHSGQVSFLPAVLGRRAVAVFSGQGSYHMEPAIKLEVNYLQLITDKPAVDEDFESAVFVFTDATYDEIKSHSRAAQGESGNNLLKDFRRRMRHRSDTPRSMIEYLLGYEDIPNIEAEALAELYNSKRGGSFCAYIHGKKHGDLRFLIKPGGAIPDLSPEEVALVNFDPDSNQEGIWYLTHRVSEWREHRASNDEDKRVVAAGHYRIETVIGSRQHLTGAADFQFEALGDGDRVIRFGLLPNLRVIRVTEESKEISFIQEDRKLDGSFYAILPAPSVEGTKYKIRIEYDGDKVVRDEGGGNFAVSARTSWYPSVNSFRDRATYDLIFKVPRQYTLVGVGKPVKEWREDDYAASEWSSDIPMAVAGFNYGYYKEKHRFDESTKYEVEAYATRELPAYMQTRELPNGGELGRGEMPNTAGMSPSSLAESAMIDAMNAIRCFSAWFGETPYGRIAITQQPEFNFGQSWPTLVYLPVSAFLDDTQRWELLGRNAFRFAEFIQEVTPHEVSHQWWGHMVGWSSLHDQWLSEGFAHFSAGLFLEQMEKKPDAANKFWERSRKTILEKNSFGKAANDAGPLWMGLRLNTFKTGGAYNRLVYPKGGYALYMIRGLMWDPKTRDRDFIDMLHDFVKTYSGRNASTDDFQSIVEKHMKPALDLDRNGKMNWFFGEWIYGTEIPSYRLKYALTKGEGGKTMLSGTITQSGVGPEFRMRVPVYLDFDGNLVKLANPALTGSMTTPEFKVALPKKPRRVILNARHDVLAAESISEGS